MFLNRFGLAASTPRTRWILAAVLFAFVTFSAYPVLSAVIKRHLGSVNASRAAITVNRDAETPMVSAKGAGPAHTDAPGKPNQAQATGNASTADMAQKLRADTYRLVELKEQRRELIAANDARLSAAQAEVFSPNYKTREDLVSELIILLNLEKQDKSESSELIALRHKIARLQAELSEADARHPPVPQAEIQASQAELGKLRYQIGVCQADILHDQQELAASSSPAGPAHTPVSSAKAAASVTEQAPPTPGAANAPQAANTPAGPMPVVLWTTVASALLGLIASALLIVWMPRSSGVISSGEALHASLAGGATFIGSIPRMKVK